ncbi:MAG: glycosyl hydrolase 115 family protein [Lachnospiraceae bacterium]|nr:glycosyl hydrolase 115 family protein [Lachnospiraceae bacterium]
MDFRLVHGSSAVPFLVEKEAYEGVRLIAGKVCADIQTVSGRLPKIEQPKKVKKPSGCVLAATVGQSPLLDLYESEGLLDLSDVKGKREVYKITVIGEGSKAVLVVAGSDKRGTIYGLFHLSESIGVSPLVYWADVVPARCKEPVIPEERMITSKEPSVKYRGFFINDEWPSFGGWTFEKFGGFTAKMYDNVFELLLRMKGNYLWPAMWSSSFPLDGPGIESAELADTYGVVMGTSHHEPCLRASEEWDKVKGTDTPYGTEWNYYVNKNGLLKYWEGGLYRSGKYENIITVGMRGERDSSMLGPDATLEENINLLKDIITEQRKLIAKYVNEDTSKVPQMLALYKEVEAYYYGDETTAGLKDWDGLDGVTLMLCEDNFGNMRTLPKEELRKRKGGYGMYYHFDYHGGPVSYEWVNSTPIAKVWEQMSMAYDYGIRDIWIVNVGDLKPQEFPLSYFMSLAYDFEKYGTSAPNTTEQFTDAFVKQQFGSAFTESELEEISYILKEYTRLNGIRRPEVMAADVYHPVHYGETERVRARAQKLAETATRLYLACRKEYKAAFCELVYFPAVASANIIQMQTAAGLNYYYAKRGMTVANRYAKEIESAILRDTELTQEYHNAAGGKWNHMMSSAHIGFCAWNDEGWKYPVAQTVYGVKGARPALRLFGEERVWLGGSITVTSSRAGGAIRVELLNGGVEPVEFEAAAEGECSVDTEKGQYEMNLWLTVTVAGGEAGTAGTVRITAGGRHFELKVERVAPLLVKLKKESFMKEYAKQVQGTGDYVSFEAGDFVEDKGVGRTAYRLLNNYGRTKDSVKVYPTTESFTEEQAKKHETPELTYLLEAAEAGEYGVVLYVAPTNPLYPGDRQCLALTANDGETQVFSTLPEHFLAGNCWNREWNENVLDNTRECELTVTLKEGENRLVVGAADAGVVLQKMVVYPLAKPLKPSYLGPSGE